MSIKRQIDSNKSVNLLLTRLSADFFEVIKLDSSTKQKIFLEIKKGIIANRNKLLELIVKEVKLTRKDAIKEINRAYNTFSFAEKNSNYVERKEITKNDKKIIEKRIPRGPLLAITPFSSPLSSPAHKIASGIIAGTSILFKPSVHAKLTGKALFDIINKATSRKYVYFLADNNKGKLQAIISDDRIGIISFTGGYETGKKIIRIGGIKKYHMELSGGNSPVIFTPKFQAYNNQLVEKLFDGITAKNGQRCVSIKHIFIPIEHKGFIFDLRNKLLLAKSKMRRSLTGQKMTNFGLLITPGHAKDTEKKVHEILNYSGKTESLIKFERQQSYLFPSMHIIHKIKSDLIKHILEYDLFGPVVFVYFYKNSQEYKKILAALKNDYIRSGLQISFYIESALPITEIAKDLLWGGIIFNDIPTFRDESMSFGGFGKAGLGKEGFFETVRAYTDPQVIVVNK